MVLSGSVLFHVTRSMAVLLLAQRSGRDNYLKRLDGGTQTLVAVSDLGHFLHVSP